MLTRWDNTINHSHCIQLKQPSRYVSMNHIIYIATYPPAVDFDHDALLRCAPSMFTQRIMILLAPHFKNVEDKM